MEPAIKTGNITGDGNVVGHGSSSTVTKTTVTSGATIADLNALLGQLRGALETAELDPKIRRVAQADLEVVEGEIADDKPSKPLIEVKLKSIAEMAKNAAAIGTAGATLAPLIHKALEMVQGLF